MVLSQMWHHLRLWIILFMLLFPKRCWINAQHVKQKLDLLRALITWLLMVIACRITNTVMIFSQYN